MTTKEKVLEKLNSNQGKAISGENLADICNVSRAAIWKAINSLRDEGFIIKGTPKGGYLLEPESDCINSQLFSSYVISNYPQFTDINVECFKEIDSTNTYAKKLLSQGTAAKRTVIVAESQTKGRGRLGRTFYSPMKSGIYLSAIYSPSSGITKPAAITAFSAVAVCRAIKKIYGIEPQIKWINDIFLNSKKIGGILTEGFTNFETGLIESAVIGIGINIENNPEEMPEDVQNIAGAIFTEKGSQNLLRCQLAAEIASQLYLTLEEESDSVIQEYKKLSFIIGQKVQVYPVIGDEKTAYIAQAVDIDNEANLIVELPDGSKKSLSSGEVSLKSISFVS